MKNILFSLAMITALITGCQKPELSKAADIEKAFTAAVEDLGSQTKTHMDYSRRVLWSMGDCIAVFEGSNTANQYQLNPAFSGSATGSFKLVADNTPDTSTDIPCNVAFYPYSEDVFITEDMNETSYTIANVRLPETQSYTQGSFANGAFPMVAVTKDLEDHNLKFKNVMGAIKLQFGGNQIVKSVTVKGNNGELLAGDAKISVHKDNLDPSIKMTFAALTEVTLDCGEGIMLNRGKSTEFIIALPPVKFTKGITVTLTDVNGSQYTISTDKENEILRSSICVMPKLTVESDGALPFYSTLFIVGSYNGWSHYNNQFLYDFYDEDCIYSGMIDFGKDHYYNEFKFTAGNWGDDEHSMLGYHEPETCTISVVPGYGDNINVYQAKRYYQLVFDRSASTLSATLSFDKLGIMGWFNGWTEDVFMNFNPTTQKFFADVEFLEDSEFKLRTDSDWAINWGVGINGFLEAEGNNIPAPAGKYRIYVDMNHPQFMTYQLNEMAYGTEEEGSESAL